MVQQTESIRSLVLIHNYHSETIVTYCVHVLVTMTITSKSTGVIFLKRAVGIRIEDLD